MPPSSPHPKLLLLLFALLAALHATLTPLFEGPDEPDNLSFIRFLVEEQRLTRPSLQPTHELEHLGRGHMPPLWFLSLAPLFAGLGATDWQVTAPLSPNSWKERARASHDPASLRAALAAPDSRLHFRHGLDETRPFSGAAFDVRILRFASIPWALVALWATWHAALRVFGDRNRATWALALVVFLPQLQFLAGTITMDLMLAAWGSLALLACVEWCSGSASRAPMWAALAGIAAGVAALTKLNGLVLAPACAAAAFTAWRSGRGFTRGALLCGLAFLLTAGPYYAWGFLETGHPLWSWRYQQVSPFHNTAQPGAWDVAGSASFAGELFLSWLAQFGWTSVWFPQWIVAPFFALYALGAASVLSALLVPRDGSTPRVVLAGAAGFALIGAALALVFLWSALGPARLGESEASAHASVVASAALVLAALPLALAALRRRAAWAAPNPATDDVTAGARPEARDPRAALAFLSAAAVLILAAEVYFNLHFQQPQARHLYPFLAALVVPLAFGLDRLRLLRAAVIAHACLTLAAFPMLASRLRPEGWNASPLWAATDASRAADPTLTEARASDAEVEWLEPAPQSAFPADAPPTLAWKIDMESEYDVVFGFRPELHHQPWRRDGAVARSTTELGLAPRGSLDLPASAWASFPGESVFVQVIRLGGDGRATGRSTVRELVRAP